MVWFAKRRRPGDGAAPAIYTDEQGGRCGICDRELRAGDDDGDHVGERAYVAIVSPPSSPSTLSHI